MPSGRHPHVESVGRKVREMRDQQLLAHRRVMPGVIPRRAKRRAWNGTTENSIVWATLRERTPLSRAERRRARIEHERNLGAIEREKRRLERDAEVAFFKRLSGDVTPLPEPTYRQAIDSLVAKAMRSGDRNERRRARASGGGAGPVPVPPSVALRPPD